MSSRRLKQRLPSARFVTTATLYQHELRFHKKGKDGSAKCDAHRTQVDEHAVMGVVFRVSSAEKSVLDSIEGIGFGYETQTIEVLAPAGVTIEAFTYYATDTDPALKPYHWYKEHVLVGAMEHSLPAGYIERIAAIEAISDPKTERHAREVAIYQSEGPKRSISLRHEKVFYRD